MKYFVCLSDDLLQNKNDVVTGEVFDYIIQFFILKIQY